VREATANLNIFTCRSHSCHFGLQPKCRRTFETQKSLSRNNFQVFGSSRNSSATFLWETSTHWSCKAVLEWAAHNMCLGVRGEKTTPRGGYCFL